MPSFQTHVIALPNKGPVENKPDEMLADAFSPYSRNMQFYNEYCQGRYGLSKFSSTALSGSVQAVANFKDLSGNEFLILATPKDIYSYDFVQARFDILTPLYTTGTIEVQVGTPTKLRGTGTLWATNLKAGDFVKIGSGSVHTGSTWYQVSVVDSDTLLTMTASMPTTAAGSAYVARKTFSGDDNDYWDWVQFSDDVKGETLLMTNGQPGEFVYWNGTGQFAPVTGLPATMTACRYLSVFGGRVHAGYTTEGGADQRQRDRWSEPVNCLSWLDDDFIDFADEPDSVHGFAKFNGYLVVFKEREAYVGRFVGGTDIFQFEISAQAYGCRGPWSIVVRNDYIYYYGHDKKFHRFNLLQDDVISETIFPETKEFDPNQDEFVQGYNVARLNEVRWFCPYGSTTKNNYTFVWNYQQSIPQVWEYADTNACASFGSYVRTSNIYADDAIYGAQYADETSGYADDSTGLLGAEIVIYGGFDGYIRTADSGTLDDGSSYTRTLRFKRINFGLLANLKRLWKQILWVESALAGSVLVRMRLDDKTSYESASNTVSLIPTTSDQGVVKASFTWDKTAQNFQPELSSTDHFSVLALISMWMPKKRSFKV